MDYSILLGVEKIVPKKQSYKLGLTKRAQSQYREESSTTGLINDSTIRKTKMEQIKEESPKWVVSDDIFTRGSINRVDDDDD